MKKVIPINNENKDICSPCGGHCCKWSPGDYTPDQLGLDLLNAKAKLTELLKQGKHIFVRHYSETLKTYWTMRPKTSLSNCRSGFEYDGLGRCIHLTDSGCEKEFDARPLECQKLIASKEKCHYPKEWDYQQDIAQKWVKYQIAINKIQDEFWDSIPTSS